MQVRGDRGAGAKLNFADIGAASRWLRVGPLHSQWNRRQRCYHTVLMDVLVFGSEACSGNTLNIIRECKFSRAHPAHAFLHTGLDAGSHLPDQDASACEGTFRPPCRIAARWWAAKKWESASRSTLRLRRPARSLWRRLCIVGFDLIPIAGFQLPPGHFGCRHWIAELLNAVV